MPRKSTVIHADACFVARTAVGDGTEGGASSVGDSVAVPVAARAGLERVMNLLLGENSVRVSSGSSQWGHAGTQTDAFVSHVRGGDGVDDLARPWPLPPL